MHRAPAIRVIAIAGALSVLNAVLLSSGASAGQFTVANCQADRASFSTTAFNDFATRGMTIRRACNPEGPGIRGLVTANSARRGAVPRGSVAMVAMSAPAGTRFTTFRWAGSARRSDCRYSLQLYAEGPDMKPVPIKNVRANQRCPRPARAQAAGYRSRTFNVTGATRIVQRVICAGGNGRRSCSARGTNYIRTYQAEVGIADEQVPAATISADTPLATGAWVAGSQPLNYVAEDNVGVRQAQAVVSDRVGGADSRACAVATADGVYTSSVPCPNGAGQISVRTTELSEGTQQLVVQPQDAAGNVGASAPVMVRIDNGVLRGYPSGSSGETRGATRTTSYSRGRTRLRAIERRSPPRTTSCAPPAAARAQRATRGGRASRASRSRFPVRVNGPSRSGGGTRRGTRIRRSRPTR